MRTATVEKIFWIALTINLLIIFKVDAQSANNNSIEANIIYRFTKYIDWPANRKSGDFIIGIIGESTLYDELKLYTSQKKVGVQSIVIRHFTSVNDISNCNILFVSENASSELKRIAGLTADAPVLIISENNGLARRGACINFIVVNGHLKLEFNKSNIEKRELKIASELLNLGTIVK